MTSTRRSAGLGAALLVALLGLVPPAAATMTTCSYVSTSKTLFISIVDPNDVVRVVRGEDDAIRVTNNLGETICSGGPTVANVDLIDVDDFGASSVTFVIDLGGGPLAPGAKKEAGSPEIEFTVSLGGSGKDELLVEGSGGGQNIRAGLEGVNLNAGEAAGVDVDVMLSGVNRVSMDGLGGDDRFDAQGGRATGDPLLVEVYGALGGAGDDRLTSGDGGGTLAGGGGRDAITGGAEQDFVQGGPRGDRLLGGPQGDSLNGDGGRDILTGGEGNDLISGAEGTDTASFSAADQGLTVDLTLSGPQATGVGEDALDGIENLIGGPFDDDLFGDGVANRLEGRDGADVLRGRAGPDHLLGGQGTDDCQGGSGFDTLTGCET